MVKTVLAFLGLILALSPASAQTAEDRYVGYYYPKPTSTEVYESNLRILPGIDRPQRIQFVTVMAQGTLQTTYRVPYAIFAKGEKADRLIVVGLQQGEMSTLYRMRGILANMTTMARLSPFFQERTIVEDATFLDLLKLMGFRDLTVTDGDALTYQVTIK